MKRPDAERTRRALALFEAALDLDEAQQRPFLERSCGADRELLREVEALLGVDREEQGSGRFEGLLEGARELGAGLQRDLRLPPAVDTGARYRIEGELARGGMGVVLEVFEESLERRLAMKIVRTDEGGAGSGGQTADASLLQRFLGEAKVTAQLDHPGIVPVHELGLDAEGRVYFTMQLVQGRELSDVVDAVHRGDPEWTRTRALGVLVQVCETMAFAHDRGVLHRDLKASNVMVGRYGEVYVMDWGLARVQGQADARDLRPATGGGAAAARKEAPGSGLVTLDGTVLGTPYFMPPEQAAGRVADLGPAADVYAVGAMLYHLLAGRPPYRAVGERPSSHEVLARVLRGPPPALRSLEVVLAPELEAICEKAMARAVEERYASMDALAADLRAYLEDRVVSAHQTGAVAELAKWVRRNRGLAASLAATIVALVAGLATALTLRARALESESLATARADDVLRLSARKDLADLLVDADALWPPHPQLIGALDDWVARAQALLDELPRHRARRAELRELARPRTPAERQADRAAHPLAEQLAFVRGERQALQRALERRRDGVEASLPAVDWSTLPDDAGGLLEVAHELVRRGRGRHGREPRGRVLAERALELAGEDAALRARALRTLAEAYFVLGEDEEALSAAEEAGTVAPPEAAEELAAWRSDLEADVRRATADEALASAADRVEELALAVAALEGEVERRRTWHYPPEHSEAEWWDEELTALIDGLEALRDPRTGLLSEGGVSPVHGWCIARRRAFAARLEAGHAQGGEFALAWEAAAPALRAVAPELAERPRVGLVPIGRDPRSGLLEFWHVASGERPQRGVDGTFALTEDTGLVLVLVPGGADALGTQADDPALANFDPEAPGGAGPVRTIRLSPFLLSKHELTQGQWLRLTGSNPSQYGPDATWGRQWLEGGGRATLLHPVEGVSWDACRTWLARFDLELPSEAQWEYACRAGSDTPWSTGASEESLAGGVNLVDEYARRFGPTAWFGHHAWLDDGAVYHAPVGSYRPNAFGLHDMHGNVWEWCLDGYEEGFYRLRPPLDPVAPFEGATYHILRGACYFDQAHNARSAARTRSAALASGRTVGVRASMPARP